ncbi:MAG: hypothetical protein ACLPX5_05010 [Dissulfurispiraceae bacterium]
MLLITDRDLDLLRYFSSGASTIYQLHGALLMMGYKISLKALRTRIDRLMQNRYLVSNLYCNRRFGNGAQALYGLTVKAQAELVYTKYPYMIRTGLPAAAIAAHEMEVTSVIRGIKKECSKLAFAVIFKDEATLRAERAFKKIKESLPDLQVRIFFKTPEGAAKIFRINMEIDNDTMAPKRLIEKLKGLKGQTMWLFTENRRMANIKRAIVETGNADLIRKVIVALQSDFIKHGFVNTNWVYPDNDPLNIVPNGVVIKKRQVLGVE